MQNEKITGKTILHEDIEAFKTELLKEKGLIETAVECPSRWFHVHHKKELMPGQYPSKMKESGWHQFFGIWFCPECSEKMADYAVELAIGRYRKASKNEISNNNVDN